MALQELTKTFIESVSVEPPACHQHRGNSAGLRSLNSRVNVVSNFLENDSRHFVTRGFHPMLITLLIQSSLGTICPSTYIGCNVPILNG